MRFSGGTPLKYHAPILNPWLYRGDIFESCHIGDSHGFVYRITNSLNGRGHRRKYFWHIKARGKTRRVRSESDWKKYYGSSAELTEDRRASGNNTFFKREILSIHASKGTCNFEETRQLLLAWRSDRSTRRWHSKVLQQ